MDISLLTIILLIWTHTIFDVVWQPDIITENKNESNRFLLKHVIIYSTPFAFFGIWYAIVNGILHFIVDWVTSRVASALWEHQKVHLYFIARVIDHAFHFSCLFITYYFLASPFLGT